MDPDREIEEELRLHLEGRIQEYIAEGMSEAEARERLAFELDSQGIWQGVGDDHCRLESAESGARRIHCAWDVEVQAWWGVFPMSFESEARMNPAGDLL